MWASRCTRSCGYPVAVPRPAPRSARSRSGLAATVVALAVGVSLTSCSTSGPGQASPTGSAVALVTPEPASSETLLPEPEADVDARSAVGELVAGFPASLIPVPDGAEVLLSSAAPVDGSDLTEVSLNVRTVQDTAGLLDAVRVPLVAAGFVEISPPAAEPGLAAQSTFSRGDGSELLVVGILDRDDERTLTLGGRVRTTAP
jgi:hypothetical protein